MQLCVPKPVNEKNSSNYRLYSYPKDFMNHSTLAKYKVPSEKDKDPLA